MRKTWYKKRRSAFWAEYGAMKMRQLSRTPTMVCIANIVAGLDFETRPAESSRSSNKLMVPTKLAEKNELFGYG